MIPIKLALRNFMCYRDNVPPLSLDGIHIACISGNNGNGKSALIDAMTWALWGRTRAKSDDDLIHQGQTEMEVEFDFAVGQQPYRIIRKHSKPKRRGRSGQTILEFQIATGNGFKSITGNSITQTQHKITDTLHMDYPTFVNSALLLQGRADEFTIKRPVERKQVLADILGLSFYDELEEQAKELAKQQETEKAQLESAIKDISDELTQKPAYEAEFERAQSQLSHIEKVITEQESRLNSLRREKESLENKKLQLIQLEEHIAEKMRELERWDDQVKQHLSRVKEYEELIAQRSTIEEGYAQFSEAKRLTDELDQKLRLVTTLNERKHQLEMTITQMGQALVKDHAVAQSRINELEISSQKLSSLKNELQQIQARLGQLAEPEEILRRKRQISQELQTKVNYLESNKAQLEREIKEVEEKLDLLTTQSDTKCPLCETELEAESLKLIEKKYAAERHSKLDSLKLNQAELAQRKTELEPLANEILQLETKLNQDRASLQTKASLISQEITEAEEASLKLNEEGKRLAEIEEHLARKDFATTEQETLQELDGELAKLGYDAQRHEQVRHRLTNLEPYEGLKRKLEEADRLISQEKEAASRAEEAAQELRHSLEVDNQKRQQLSEELNLLPQLVNDLTQAETEHQGLAAQQTQAQETIWNVKGKLQRCSELERKRKEKEKLVAQASKQEKIYRDLAQAFGKRGIQALLIERALPEIEAEANKLLGRMTDNRMHIKIETQRETKKGNVIETLDINISDELGTRNYEMFSGGEAFRINFAIRIALSKLLARRAGAPLPTLVIDEGFGTQDSVGIEKLKEAINSIQDDFDKILVITHIEELRDAFPNRINVIKTTQGSTLEVS
ncbi:MAG: SMC family ATPase [Dehalococcoidia bacterium]|nr:MAG: SMC family ATPase [Dehalococcoidia bacterium]